MPLNDPDQYFNQANQNIAGNIRGARARPAGIRSATFVDAGGGAQPRESRQAQYKARERQLLAGLPRRTSAFERERDLRNSQVGGGTAEQRAALQAPLRKQYADEDAGYTNAYAALTGRQDTGTQADRQRQNALALQGSQNQGTLEQTGLRNTGALDVASIQGADAYNTENLRQGGLGERQSIRSAAADRRLAADVANQERISGRADVALQADIAQTQSADALARDQLAARTAQAQAGSDLARDKFTSLYGGAQGLETERQRRGFDAEDAAKDRQNIRGILGIYADGNTPLVDSAMDVLEATRPELLAMEPGRQRDRAIKDFMLQHSAEMSGAVRDFSKGDFSGKPQGFGSLSGRERGRTVGIREAFLRSLGNMATSFGAGPEIYNYRRGDVLYGDGLAVNPEDLPKGIRSAVR